MGYVSKYSLSQQSLVPQATALTSALQGAALHVPPVQVKCRFEFANATAIEKQAALATLTKSGLVAGSFIRIIGAVGARGTFIPTVIDSKYWFAKLYELITFFEIGSIPRFKQPAFVMHFIPIFYDMYADALRNFQNGNLAAVSPLWLWHFQKAARPKVEPFSAWQRDVQNSINTGVTAHIRGDMATALERAYRSFVAKYCLQSPPPLDSFKADFFEYNRPVFEAVQASFFLELSRLGPFPVGPEIGQQIIGFGAGVFGGLDVKEIFEWRKEAWAKAKAALGQQ